MIGDAAGRQQQLERVGQLLEVEPIKPSSQFTFDVEPIPKLELCGGGGKVGAQSLGLRLRLDLRGGGGDGTWWGWADGLRQQLGGPRAPALPEASATSEASAQLQAPAADRSSRQRRQLSLPRVDEMGGKGTLYAVAGGATPGLYLDYGLAQSAGAWSNGIPSSKFKYNVKNTSGGSVYKDRESSGGTLWASLPYINPKLERSSMSARRRRRALRRR